VTLMVRAPAKQSFIWVHIGACSDVV
jgi:hypothetical protein